MERIQEIEKKVEKTLQSFENFCNCDCRIIDMDSRKSNEVGFSRFGSGEMDGKFYISL